MARSFPLPFCGGGCVNAGRDCCFISPCRRLYRLIPSYNTPSFFNIFNFFTLLMHPPIFYNQAASQKYALSTPIDAVKSHYCSFPIMPYLKISRASFASPLQYPAVSCTILLDPVATCKTTNYPLCVCAQPWSRWRPAAGRFWLMPGGWEIQLSIYVGEGDETD